MKTVGIIAEYNPFHNGHKYQIEYVKTELEADRVIVAMSGAFTQRGLPAVCSGFSRASAACKAGADCVVEMPVCVSVADTELFALGAVDILFALGCDAIAFGSENGNLKTLDAIAQVMISQKYEELYYRNMQQGIAPPMARELAIRAITNFDDTSFINEPNNLLGIYYLCAIKRRNYNIKPYTHKRVGQAYFSSSLSDCDFYASASAIRNEIYANACFEEVIKKHIPEYMLHSLIKEKATLLFAEDFENEYLNSIINCSEEKWQNICQLPPREYVPYDPIVTIAKETKSFSEIKKGFSKYVTPLRADRMINWIMLDQQRLSLKEFMQNDHIGYRIISNPGIPELEPIVASDTLITEWNTVYELYQRVKQNKLR